MRTEGLWQKCDGCRQIIWKKDLEANWNVCPKCARHFRIDAAMRLKLLLDGGAYQTFDSDLRSADPLHFAGQDPTGRTLFPPSGGHRPHRGRDFRGGQNRRSPGAGVRHGHPRFIGGSVGCVVGEKITRAIERAIAP